jgi:hypothetical protein
MLAVGPTVRADRAGAARGTGPVPSPCFIFLGGNEVRYSDGIEISIPIPPFDICKHVQVSSSLLNGYGFGTHVRPLL